MSTLKTMVFEGFVLQREYAGCFSDIPGLYRNTSTKFEGGKRTDFYSPASISFSRIVPISDYKEGGEEPSHKIRVTVELIGE